MQSGSDRVLKLMHRGYTRERFLGIIEKLRRVQPAIGLSTDFIVGFPGETEADFEETLSLAREVGFDQAFVFKYSQRRDTPAADMPGQVDQAVKEERNQRLLEVVNASGARQHQKFVGRQVQILVEGPSKKNPARMTGRTRCNKIVVFDGSARHRGQLLDVKIQRAGAFTLYGEVDEAANWQGAFRRGPFSRAKSTAYALRASPCHQRRTACHRRHIAACVSLRYVPSSACNC